MIPGCYYSTCQTYADSNTTAAATTATTITGQICYCDYCQGRVVTMSFSSAPERDDPWFALPPPKPRLPQVRPMHARLPSDRGVKPPAYKRSCY